MLTARLTRLPAFAVLTRRAYSEFPGSVAQSQGFNKKEKAHEDQYVRNKEKEELEKLRAQLQKMQETVDKLEKKTEKVVEETKK